MMFLYRGFIVYGSSFCPLMQLGGKMYLACVNRDEIKPPQEALF